MHSFNYSNDFKMGRLSLGEHKPRSELPGVPQKSPEPHDLYRKYKQKLMQPLQSNHKLDLLALDRDLVTPSQLTNVEPKQEIERLMSQINSITSFSQNVFKNSLGYDTKPLSTTSHKEDLLKKHLRKEIYERLKVVQNREILHRGSQGNQPRNILLTEEEDHTALEKVKEDEGERDDISKSLRKSSQEKKTLKQLNNNVHFRYSKRKLLLLRSQGLAGENEEGSRTLLQKNENSEFQEKKQNLKQKLVQQVSKNHNRIIMNQQNMYDFHNNKQPLANVSTTKEEYFPRRHSSTFLTRINDHENIGNSEIVDQLEVTRNSHRAGGSRNHLDKQSGEARRITPRLLQYSEETALSDYHSNWAESAIKDLKPKVINLKIGKKLREINGTPSPLTLESRVSASHGMVSNRSQSKKETSFEEGVRKIRLPSERNSVGASDRKRIMLTPDLNTRNKALSFLKDQTPLTKRSTNETYMKFILNDNGVRILSKTPEKRIVLKPFIDNGPSSARLETESVQLSTRKEEKDKQPPSIERMPKIISDFQNEEFGEIKVGSSTGKWIGNAWEKGNEPAGKSEKNLEEDTSTILSNYGYRDYSLAETKRSLSANRVRCSGFNIQKGVLPRKMMEKTEQTVKNLILRKQKQYDFEEKTEGN